MINTNGVETLYYGYTDYQGSLIALANENGNVVQRYAYDPWGARRNPANWTLPGSPPVGDLGGLNRGYTGHEHLDQFGIINMNGRVYDPLTAQFFSPDPYLQAPGDWLNYNRYGYCMNNPFRYTDPSGEFITWSISTKGISIGVNLTPIGIPLGAGINIGWSKGGSVGIYGEVGYRVGGTGLGAGATASQSLDISFKNGNFTTTSSIGVYGSLGLLNAGINGSYTYNIDNKQGTWGWGVSAGINIGGNDKAGLGLTIGYGSDGFSFGLGGYYNPLAWKDNPTYEPEKWNDDSNIQNNNNCYSYALDDPDNPIGGKPQPGDYSKKQFTELTLDNITQAAINDGRIRKPNFWNRLGFGKKGYYEAYLVIDNADAVQDYHWYRQDKGGNWSQKHGSGIVTNIDGSGKTITNPVYANHYYGTYYNNYGKFIGNLNYNGGGVILWVKRKY